MEGQTTLRTGRTNNGAGKEGCNQRAWGEDETKGLGRTNLGKKQGQRGLEGRTNHWAWKGGVPLGFEEG
jgi:hypothetical protein